MVRVSFPRLSLARTENRGDCVIAVSGKLNDGTIAVFVGSIAACGVAALVLGAVSLRPRKLRGRR